MTAGAQIYCILALSLEIRKGLDGLAAACVARDLGRRSSLNASNSPEIASGEGAGLVLEDRHGRCHRPETERLVEEFSSRHAIENDFPVSAGQPHKPSNNLPAEPGLAMAGQHGDIAEISAIPAICQHPPGPDEARVVENEGPEHAVAEYQLQVGRRLVAERRHAIER